MEAVAETPKKPVRILAGTKVGIPPRQLNFRVPESAPRYFYDNNGTATLFFAMLSAIFPPGEDFFVESVRRFRDQIDDPELKAQVSGFIGQEAIHGREHQRLNDMLAANGFDMQAPDRAIRVGLWLLEQLPAKTQLACTTLMEHFTALLGEQLLTDELFARRADPEMIQLWFWHALEELEHKAVCYDVYELLGNSRTERVMTLPLVGAALLPAILGSWGYMMAKDGVWKNPRDLRRGMGLLFGKRGFVTRILPKMGLFARPDFHPDKKDTRALVSKWRDKLFGEKGSLSADVKNLESVTIQ
jgi:predicted metal-dependent hydrolase